MPPAQAPYPCCAQACGASGSMMRPPGPGSRPGPLPISSLPPHPQPLLSSSPSLLTLSPAHTAPTRGTTGSWHNPQRLASLRHPRGRGRTCRQLLRVRSGCTWPVGKWPCLSVAPWCPACQDRACCPRDPIVTHARSSPHPPLQSLPPPGAPISTGLPVWKVPPSLQLPP